MKRVITSGTRSPRKENIRKICDYMDWNLPTFSDPGSYGYSCKWGGRTLVDKYGIEQVEEWIQDIKDGTGIECKLTRSGKLIVPYAE